MLHAVSEECLLALSPEGLREVLGERGWRGRLAPDLRHTRLARRVRLLLLLTDRQAIQAQHASAAVERQPGLTTHQRARLDAAGLLGH